MKKAPTKPLTDDPATSYTLPSEYYLSAEIYELEKQQIFYQTWQYITHESMLPNVGDYITETICDESIFIIRCADGEIHGFYNVCRHRAHQLLTGEGNTNTKIVCPYHAWTYQIDGALLAARLADQRPDFNKANFGLKPVRVEIFCGCIFVNLNAQAESLNTLAGDLEKDIKERTPHLAEMTCCDPALQGETVNQAGWKVVVDNFLECYHCAPAHPAFASLIDMKAYQVETFKYWSRQIGPKIRNKNDAYEVAPAVGNQFTAAWFLWPNTVFNILPGTFEFSAYTIRPLSVDTCAFKGHSLARNGDLDKSVDQAPDKTLDQARSKYAADILTTEDIALCESVQRGLKSNSYEQGPYMYSPTNTGISEHAVHHFHHLLHNTLTTTKLTAAKSTTAKSTTANLSS